MLSLTLWAGPWGALFAERQREPRQKGCVRMGRAIALDIQPHRRLRSPLPGHRCLCRKGVGDLEVEVAVIAAEALGDQGGCGAPEDRGVARRPVQREPAETSPGAATID
ncbi:MAG: hypothetical protein NVS2B6_04250 [Thermoleophilaceae bacterium]